MGGPRRLRPEELMRQRLLLLLATSLLVIGGISIHAVGRTSTALHGYAYPADRACFGESWGAMVNGCTTTKSLFVPVSMDSQCTVSSNWTVVSQSASSSSNVCCRTLGIENNGAINFGELRCMSQFSSTPQAWTLAPAAPWSKRLFFACDVGPGAKVIGVDWAPKGNC
jgi:hypothetical protein